MNYIAGAEAQFYQGDWTFYLQAGWLDSERSDDVDMIRDALFARGVVRHYFGADTLFQAEAAYVSGEMDDDDDDMDIWSVGARLQHRFDFWPGAFYVGYRGDFADQDDTAGPIDSHMIQFGATYTFGSDSLQDNERHGAAMDLPAFMSWQGIAAGPRTLTRKNRGASECVSLTPLRASLIRNWCSEGCCPARNLRSFFLSTEGGVEVWRA